MTLTEQVPIACSLNASDAKRRSRKIAELNWSALRSYRRDGLRLELVYAWQAREQVMDMVRRERSCCTFLSFEIIEQPDSLRVIVEAPEAARDAADGVFEALYSKALREAGTPSATSSDCESGNKSNGRIVGASASVAAVGALACGVCCILPFALPAAVLAMSGGVIGWFAKATPWALGIAVIAVLSGWGWVARQTLRTKLRPAKSTYVLMGLATVMLVTSIMWWHFERDVILLLRPHS
jgi:hypothetical protein